jgi:hypothetical protein
MNETHTTSRRRVEHVRPLSARLPIWDQVGDGLSQAVVALLISVEVWKTDKAAGGRPD